MGLLSSRKSLVVAVLIVLMASGLYPYRYRLWEFSIEIQDWLASPDLTWDSLPPSQAGLDRDALDRWRKQLAAHDTDAVLVVRGNKVVYEWYGFGAGPNAKHYTSAMAKPLLGITTLLVCLTDGRMDLDDSISKFVPALKPDPVRSRIRVRDLAFHTAGLDDVDFVKGKAGQLEGWKKDYYEHRDKRFQMAVFDVPFLFPPGTREKYAGVGYYALAYVVTRALQDAPQKDIKTLLRERIMEPLHIPDAAWRISYGEEHEADGLRLYAFGSGASLTARTAARIGQLMLDRGRWGGKTLIEPSWVDRVLDRGFDATQRISTNHGWILNVDGKWPSLPPDAFLGVGGGQQLTLVVPSLDLVMVRNGEALGHSVGSPWALLDSLVFRPLMQAVTGSGPRGRDGVRQHSLSGGVPWEPVT